MNELLVLRMGKVNAGQEDAEVKTEKHKSPLSETMLERNNLPVPIVLWAKGKAAGVLYFSRETRVITGTLRQKIDYLYSPAHGMKGRIKSMFDAYPIVFSTHGIMDKDDERTMNCFDNIYTKDINGDGIDELIITRNLGGVEVYDREKQLFKYSPQIKPKLYEYKMKDVFFATIDTHEEVFFATSRQRYDNEDTNNDKGTRNCGIVRVGPDGIREITPTFPDHKDPETIESIVGLNKPGSKGIDELILICTFKDMKGYYLSRHTLEGRPLDKPRKIYAEDYDPAYFAMYQIPQSNQLIAHCGKRKRLYFITPEKPVNWFETVKLNKLPGDGANSFLIEFIKKNGITAGMIENENSLYIIDSNGKYHNSLPIGSSKSKDPAAFATIKPISKLHKIIDISTIDNSMENILVIQSREPGKRELTIGELEKAGERFLSDDEWKHCKDELIPQYYSYMDDSIKFYCEQHKIKMPEINSLNDIKTKLPGYYAEMVKDTKWSYQNSLKRGLFRPFDYENYSIDQSEFKNKEEYKKWLANAFITPELVVTIHHLSDGTVASKKLSDYYYKNMDQSGLSQPAINIRASGDHGQAFLVLQKKVLNKNFKPAYYTIVW